MHVSILLRLCGVRPGGPGREEWGWRCVGGLGEAFWPTAMENHLGESSAFMLLPAQGTVAYIVI
jgi:hypothetical protein